MEYVLRTYGLCKHYKGAPVVADVSMNIRRGEIYGFVGKNGAGKTTLMRLVCGLIRKTGGSYELFGRTDTDPALDLSRRRVGSIIESPSLYPDMTAEDNLREQSLVLGLRGAKFGGLLEYVGLADTGKKKVRNFSLGMRQRLGIAMALVGQPDFIVLDEPVNGLDPQGIVEIRELLLRLNAEKGITVLISSHILGELSRLATCYGFIDGGRLIREISAADLESACRKSVRITVDSTASVACALERGMGIEDYRILSDTQAEIYGEVNVGELAFALRDAGVSLLRVHERDEDLEGYFLNLVGGEKC